MATKGSKVKFSYGDASTAAGSASWTPIARIVDITPPKLEADDIETSNMDSPNDVKEWAPGWADAGEVELTIQYDKDQASTIMGLFRIQKGYRIEYPDAPSPSGTGSRLAFDGYIKAFSDHVDRKDIITEEITVKVIGLPTFTKAAA
jgi:hypothetical protein